MIKPFPVTQSSQVATHHLPSHPLYVLSFHLVSFHIYLVYALLNCCSRSLSLLLPLLSHYSSIPCVYHSSPLIPLLLLPLPFLFLFSIFYFSSLFLYVLPHYLFFLIIFSPLVSSSSNLLSLICFLFFLLSLLLQLSLFISLLQSLRIFLLGSSSYFFSPCCTIHSNLFLFSKYLF